MKECDICSNHIFKPLWVINGFYVQKCPNCGLVFANVEQVDIADIYEENYYKKVYPDYQSDKNIHDKNHKKLLDRVERFFTPGDVVEIGSAFGFFLEVASKRGWKTLGYEVSQYASMIAKREYRQEVRNSDFLNHPIEEKCDLVCMFDTIEHLISPARYIKKIHQALRVGGGLVITTGDIESHFARICGKNWRMLCPPLHVYYFSRQTLKDLLHRYGFEILAIHSESKFQNFNSVIQYLFGINKSFIPNLPISINLGDIMQVIARKK